MSRRQQRDLMRGLMGRRSLKEDIWLAFFVGVWRFVSGAHMDGQPHSNATFWRPGTEGTEDHPEPTKWELRSRRDRAWLRVGPIITGLMWLYAMKTRPGPMRAATVGFVLLLAVYGVYRGYYRIKGAAERRRLAEEAAAWEQFHTETVRPLAEAMASHFPGWDADACETALDFRTEGEGEAAEVALRIYLPDAWDADSVQRGSLTQLVNRRFDDEMRPTWQTLRSPFYVDYHAMGEREPLPTMVPWKLGKSAYEPFMGVTHSGDRYIDMKSQTPHVGITAPTNFGKTTGLLLPVVNVRKFGILVDYIDLKEESVDVPTEGVSGVRVHRSLREGVAVTAEFFTSMKSIRSAKLAGFPEDEIIGRVLVIDELSSFMPAALQWWKGQKKRGQKTRDDEDEGFRYGTNIDMNITLWFIMSLMQGRSKDHRFILGPHDFDVSLFGGQTSNRDQVGTRIVLGACAPPKWMKCFGAGTYKPKWDDSIKGRGAIGVTGAAESPEEIQLAYFTEQEGNALLLDCPPAPEWFDRGDIAPWITPAGIAIADDEALVSPFLPGGEHMESLPRLAPSSFWTKKIEAARAKQQQERERVTVTASQPKNVSPDLPESPVTVPQQAPVPAPVVTGPPRLVLLKGGEAVADPTAIPAPPALPAPAWLGDPEQGSEQPAEQGSEPAALAIPAPATPEAAPQDTPAVSIPQQAAPADTEPIPVWAKGPRPGESVALKEEKPIGLSAACRTILSGIAGPPRSNTKKTQHARDLDVVRAARGRDDSFPDSVATRGNEKLYLPSALLAWQEGRIRAVNADGGA